MLHTKLTMIMVFVLSLGLVSCCLVSEKVGLGPGLKEKVVDVNAKIAILIDDEGKIVVTDSEGNLLKPCTIEPSKNQCRGLEKGYQVNDLSSVTIIRSEGSPFCYTIYDLQDRPHEFCW